MVFTDLKVNWNFKWSSKNHTEHRTRDSKRTRVNNNKKNYKEYFVVPMAWRLALNYGDKMVMESQQPAVSRTAGPRDEVEIIIDSSVVLFAQMIVDSIIVL